MKIVCQTHATIERRIRSVKGNLCAAIIVRQPKVNESPQEPTASKFSGLTIDSIMSTPFKWLALQQNILANWMTI